MTCALTVWHANEAIRTSSWCEHSSSRDVHSLSHRVQPSVERRRTTNSSSSSGRCPKHIHAGQLVCSCQCCLLLLLLSTVDLLLLLLGCLRCVGSCWHSCTAAAKPDFHHVVYKEQRSEGHQRLACDATKSRHPRMQQRLQHAALTSV